MQSRVAFVEASCDHSPCLIMKDGPIKHLGVSIRPTNQFGCY